MPGKGKSAKRGKMKNLRGRKLGTKAAEGVKGGAEGYSVRDKQKVEVLNPQRITMKSG